MKTLLIVLLMVSSNVQAKTLYRFCGPTGLCHKTKTVDQYHTELGQCIADFEEVLDEVVCFRRQGWEPGNMPGLFDQVKYEMYLEENGIVGSGTE